MSQLSIISSTGRNLSWKADLPDIRDKLYSKFLSSNKKLPNKIDLRRKMSAVEDQGNVGSCVGNSIVGCLEYLENKNIPKSDFVDLSRLFVYYNARMIENTTRYDCGCYIRNGIKAVAKYGVCKESDWPYIPEKYAIKPYMKSYLNALPNRITSYYRLNTIDDMLHCLSERYPFVFGMSVYDYFESEEIANTGILKMPEEGERVNGGHAITAVGYDINKRIFIIRNSWGSSWGKSGYFYMPFDYISNSNLCCDFWTIRQ